MTESAPTRRGVHERLAAMGPPAPVEFNPARTLKLRVEFVRQVKRRRTQFALLVLLALPILMAAAFKLGGGAKGPLWRKIQAGGYGQAVEILTAEEGGIDFELPPGQFEHAFRLGERAIQPL